MSEYVSLKTKDLVEVWEQTECEEVVEVLEGLYPDVLPPKEEEKKERDVTDEIKLEYLENDFFIIKHLGTEIARQLYRSKVEGGRLTIKFEINNSGYHFVLAGGNWRVIKEDG